jgi:DNA-directed RNA polymerase specialized sigma subunit
MGLFDNFASTSPFLIKEAFAFDADKTKDEEMKLLERFKKGDTMAGKELRLSMRPLVDKGIQLANKPIGDISSVELRMIASNELNNILLRYDPNNVSGASLSSWVVGQVRHYVNNAILDMAPGSHVSRPDLSKLRQVQRAEIEAKMQYGPEVTAQHINEFLPDHVKIKNDFNEIDRMRKYDTKDLIGDATFSRDEESGDVSFKDKFSDDFDHGLQEDVFLSSKLDRMEQTAKQKLNQQEYEIVKNVLFDGEPRVKYALRMGIPGSQVAKAINKWKKIVDEEHLTF